MTVGIAADEFGITEGIELAEQAVTLRDVDGAAIWIVAVEL